MFRIIVLAVAVGTSLIAAEVPSNFLPANVAAWCIVPFDAKQRGPAARVAMLKELGIRRCAYDWRAKHVAEFEEEFRLYKEHGIELLAFWGTHDTAFKLFEKYGHKPQIWYMIRKASGDTREARVTTAVQSLIAVAEKTQSQGLKLALYNHGGWGGEPANLVAVVKALRDRGFDHVGIVYNWHHGHGHLDDWPESLKLMLPYLYCLNLNGMNAGAKPKILPLAQGQYDKQMMQAVWESGYDGPIGILDHQNHLDSKEALLDNLAGLKWLGAEIANPGSGGAKPTPLAGKSAAGPVPAEQSPPAGEPEAGINPDIPFDRRPIDESAHPYWREFVNRHRYFDFYAKQARHYADTTTPGDLIPDFPGLDGGRQGHWGNQNDQTTWKDGRIRKMQIGSMVGGVFSHNGKHYPRAYTVSLGSGHHAVFDVASCRFIAAWQGEAVAWSDVRRGLMRGIPKGQGGEIPLQTIAKKAPQYLGLYRSGERVVFAYRSAGNIRYVEARVEGDNPLEPGYARIVETLVDKPAPQATPWPVLTTKGSLGSGKPYAIDTLAIPYDNPGNWLFFLSGIDALTADKIAVCTLHGDVWICELRKDDLSELAWTRFAAGLHQPLGLKVVDGTIHVTCRDQIVALHDQNADGEADYYECVSMAHEASRGAHDFVTGLQRDIEGRWYLSSGNQGVCRISPDGKAVEVLATGFRNPHGLGISPDGTIILTSVQEGNWTPASAICEIGSGGHFGAGGPRKGPRGNVPPLLYLPRGVDNSAAGQVYVDSDRWGPARGNFVHFSFGAAAQFLLLRQVVNGVPQAAAVPLKGEFLSGSQRGRFSPYDGQLYVAGAQGWGSYGVKDGSLQRVRFVGGDYPYPTRFEARDNGIMLTFADAKSAEFADPKRWFAQQWNYKYGPSYGSPEYSVLKPDQKGHDRLGITSAHRLAGNRVFLEIPQIQPVNQLHLHFDGDHRLELFATIHNLAPAFTDFSGYRKIAKTNAAGIPAADLATTKDPKVLVTACAACHHPTNRVVGPSLAEIRQKYADNPAGIVAWAENPQVRNPDLPPMPSFAHMGKERLKVIADYILALKE